MVFLKNYFINTTLEVDFLPITSDVKYAIRDANGKDGLVTVAIPGAGASVIVFEPIKEVIDELKTVIEMFAGEKEHCIDKRKEQVMLAPRIQTAIFGRFVSLPIKDGRLMLDPYEEIYLIDFDKKIRRREFFVQVMSEDAQAAQAAPKGQPLQKKK